MQEKILKNFGHESPAMGWVWDLSCLSVALARPERRKGATEPLAVVITSFITCHY